MTLEEIEEVEPGYVVHVEYYERDNEKPGTYGVFASRERAERVAYEYAIELTNRNDASDISTASYPREWGTVFEASFRRNSLGTSVTVEAIGSVR